MFVGDYLLSTDTYVANGGNGTDGLAKEWYINTASFYRQIRNIKVDITGTYKAVKMAGIHWQVAQATSMFNVEVTAVKRPDLIGIGTVPARYCVENKLLTRHIVGENGSGGQVSDITIKGASICWSK